MGNHVQIEVFEHRAIGEVWVKAMTNQMMDWPRIKAGLSKEQAAVVGEASSQPLKYYPHMVTADEREEHGYMFEDWFIFKRTYKVKAMANAR